MSKVTRRSLAGVPELGGVFVGRNVRTNSLYSLAPEARRKHMHVIGASGGGKSNLLEVLARQDILQVDGAPRGMTFLDPHGQTIQSLIEWIAEHRLHRYDRRIRILDATDPQFAFAFNPWLALSTFERSVLVDLLTHATQAAWGQDAMYQTPQLTEALQELYSALAVLKLPLADSADFLFQDRERIRGYHMERLRELDEDCWSFWNHLQFHVSSTRRDEYLAPVRRRLAPFRRSPNIKRVLSQTERALDLAEEMDRGSILLINLKQGEQLSYEMSRLLGTLLINEYYTACFRRKDVKLPHFLYVDECHQFLSPDIARILDQSRKFGLSMTLAHQHLGHLREAGEHIFRSVMTNTLVKVIFGGLDAEDAEYMAKLTFRGKFNLQRPKELLYRPTAVGSKAVWLEQESETENRSRAASSTWSAGTATTESAAYTKNRSRSATRSHTDNRSQTDSWSRAHGVSSSVASIDTSTDGQGTSHTATIMPMTASFFSPTMEVAASDGETSSTSHSTGTVVAEASSDTHTVGGASATGSADSRAKTLTTGTGTTRGTATTTSSQSGGSQSDTIGHGTSRGRGQAFVTEYHDMPGPLWDLADQLHVKSVYLAHLRVGHAVVRVANQRPCHVVLPYVGDQSVLPERVLRARREILLGTPFVAPAAQVDLEYAQHRQQLLEASTPPEPDDAQGEAPAETADPARQPAAANKQEVKKREWK